jgi:hypothetical protein
MLSVHMLLTAAFAAQITWVPAQPGVEVGAPRVLSERGGPPAAAAQQGGPVVTWLEPGNGPKEPACVVAAVLGREGAARAQPVRLACKLSEPGPPVIASHPGGSLPGGSLIVWSESGGLTGMIVSPRLRARPAFHVPLHRRPAEISVAHDGKRYLVAWADYEHVRLVRAGNDGKLQSAPEILTTRPDRHSIEQTSISCARGACALLYRKFLGNSQTTVHGVSLAQGVVSGTFDVGPGPFDIATAPGATAGVVGLLSTYDRMWAVPLPGNTQTPLFSIESRGERIRDLAAASAPHGTLVAWWAEPRAAGTSGVAFAYVPASPDAARPSPIALEREASPMVVTVDEKRFLLLTTRAEPGKPGRAVVARWITVEPKHFVRAVSVRPPVVRGRVLTPDGQLASGAQVHFQIQLRGGTRTSSSVLADRQGAFEIRHPEAKDLRPEADVTGGVLWAYREGEVSTLHPVSAGPLDISLQPVATLAGRIVGSQRRGVARLRVQVMSPDSTWNDRSIIWSREQEIDLGNPVFDLGEVPSGMALIEATTGSAGELAGAVLHELRPGAAARISVPLGRRGSLRLRVSGNDARGRRVAQFVVVITPGRGMAVDDMLVEQVAAGEAQTWDQLVPGEQVVNIATQDGFVMRHRVTIKPGGAAVADIAFRADLPPGKVGMVLDLRGNAIVVVSMLPGSPADAVGIRPGDAILSVDGKTPTAVAEAVSLLGGPPGSEVVVRVRSAAGERELRLRRSGP